MPSAAADVFRSIAQAIVTDVAPPVNMAGCTARVADTPVSVRRG
jgi:hypothetical protein